MFYCLSCTWYKSPVGLKEAGTAAVFGFIAIFVGFLVARLVVEICQIEEQEKPAFCFCSGIFNYGFCHSSSFIIFW